MNALTQNYLILGWLSVLEELWVAYEEEGLNCKATCYTYEKSKKTHYKIVLHSYGEDWDFICDHTLMKGRLPEEFEYHDYIVNLEELRLEIQARKKIIKELENEQGT